MNQNYNQERRKNNPPRKRPGNSEDARRAERTGQRRNGQRRKPVKSRWYKQRRRKKRLKMLKQHAGLLIVVCVVAMGLLCLAVTGICSLFSDDKEQKNGKKAEIVKLDGEIEKLTVDSPPLNVKLLTVNEYSRPGTKLDKVNGIVIHYVGNPGTTALQNRSYFESLKDTHKTSASSHFVIGMEGEIVQCIPTVEVAYCSNQRNNDTISIECCHEKKDGKFSEKTYDSLVHLTAFLCCKYDLEIEDIIRHYDITEKECPKYYVTHEDKWVQFKKDVAAYIEENSHVSE